MKVVITLCFAIALLMVNGCAITCLAVAYRQDNLEISAEIHPQAIDVVIVKR